MALLPFMMSLWAASIFAYQSDEIHRRLNILEIQSAREDERHTALTSRVNAIDKTLWWLIVAILTNTGVSGAVAVDRAKFKLRRQE